MSEQEITKTHFSENWAVEQVATHMHRGIGGWACVPNILRDLASKHRRSAFDALRIAYTLRLIEMRVENSSDDPISADELAMCPQSSDGQALAWARVRVRQ
jgi:hypothetical protein